MKKVLKEGARIKVTDAGHIYKDLDDVAKELGATDKLNQNKPVNGSEGDVLGVKDGYVLVDFGSYECLLDIDAIQLTTKAEDVKILLRFMHNNAIEEFEDQESVNKRIEELVRAGNIRLDAQLKQYQVSASKIVSLGVNISLK